MNKKKKVFYLYFVIGLCLMVLFWGGMLRRSFNADTLFFFVDPESDIWTWIGDGRYITGLINMILMKFGITSTTYISLTVAISFCITACAIAFMGITFEDWFIDSNYGRWGMFAGISLSLCSVLYTENWMFTEMCYSFALAYFCAALAAYYLKQEKYIRMLIFLFIGIYTYQAAIIFFLILELFVIYYESGMNISWKTVWKSIWISLSAVFVLGFNYMNMCLFTQLGVIKAGKGAGIGSISDKIRNMVQSILKLYKDADGLLPNLYIPLIFTIIVMGTITFICLRDKKGLCLIYNWLLFVVCHLIIYIIPFALPNFSLPCRLSFVFFQLQGMFLLNAIYLIKEKQYFFLLGMGYLFVHLLFCNFIITNHFVSNTLDEVYAHLIVNTIEKYENKTGIKVTKLAVCRDDYAPNGYDEVSYKSHETNERSLSIVPRSTLEYFTGRTFEPVEMSKEIRKKYFEGKDWEYFDAEEQIIIVEDTAYWCIF